MSAARNSQGYLEGLGSFFERVGVWSYDHRWIVLAGSVGVLALCLVFASRTRFDNSYEAYFDPRDPVYAAYNQFRADFGSDEISYILYEAPDHAYGPWNLEVMRKIVHLTEALENDLPFVQEVTSLANVEFMEGIPDGLKIYELLQDFPESQAALLAVKQQVLKKPLYVGGLASRDGRYAAIQLEMDRSSVDPVEEIRFDPEGGDGLDNLYPQVTYDRIEQILSLPEYEGIRFHHAGDVPLNSVYNRIAEAESSRLGAICLGVIGLLLFYFFRTPVGVLGPLVVVSLSVVASIALVGALGWSLDLMYIMLPTLLIAVGVADAVHIISEFRAQHATLGDRREATRHTMRLVGTPCLLTSLTTAGGLAAMSVSSIKAISHFALYSAVGVIAAFFFSVTLLMLFLSFGRRRPAGTRSEAELEQAKGGRVMRNALEAVGRFDIRHRRPIIFVFGALFVFSALGIARLRVDSNFLNELSDRVPIKRTTEFVDETMGGVGSIVYLFDAGAPDGIKEPAVLREIERLQAEADQRSFLVMKTYSIVDVLKDINQSFHDGDRAHHVVPDTRELVAQYLLLYEMSGGAEVDEYVSSDYSRANLELRVKLKETSFYQRLVDDLDSYLHKRPLRASSVSLTGMGALWLKLQDYITLSQIRGFLLAFSVIAVLMCLLFRSLKIGLIAMMPSLAPVILTLGMMGWMGIPLDYVRLLIGALAIGISVDDTIHHTTRYLHEFGRSGDYEVALLASMRDVGRALFITSVALILGFLVLVTSIMATLATFALLIAATVFVALVADFLLMPALVLSFEPFGPKR